MATYTPRRGTTYDPSATVPEIPMDQLAQPSQLERGFRASLRSAAADGAAHDYYKAAAAGDAAAAQAAGLRAQDYSQQAQAVAPRVGSVGQVNGVGDAVDYGLGLIGGAPLSIAEPAVGGAAGGLAAAAIGSRFGLRPQLAGRMLQGGGAVGAVAPMYGQFRDAAATEHYQHELLTGQRQDPNEVLGTIQERGLAQALPYLAAPMATAPGRIGAGRSVLPQRSSQLGSAVQGMAVGAGADVASTVIGQNYRDTMDPTRNRSGDMTEIADEVIGGAIVGAPFEAAGHIAQGAQRAAGAAGGMALRGGQAAAEYIAPRATEAWENRPRSMDEAAVALGAFAGEMQNRGEDAATVLAAKRFTKDADIDTLLAPQEGMGADQLMQDDATKHAAASSLLDKIVASPSAFPQYVQAAAGAYGNSSRDMDSWKQLSGAVNDWQRSVYLEQDLNEMFKGKWESGMQKAGEMGANLMNAKDAAKDAYEVTRHEAGRMNAQTPRTSPLGSFDNNSQTGALDAAFAEDLRDSRAKALGLTSTRSREDADREAYRAMREERVADANRGVPKKVDTSGLKAQFKRDEFSLVLEKALSTELKGFSGTLGQDVASQNIAHAMRLWATNGFKLPGDSKPSVPARLAEYFKDPSTAVSTALDLMERQGVIEPVPPKVKARMLYVLGAKVEARSSVLDIVRQNLVPTLQSKLKMPDVKRIAGAIERQLESGRLDEAAFDEHFGPKAEFVINALLEKQRQLEAVETEGDGTRTAASLDSDESTDSAGHEELAGMTDPFTPNEVATDTKWHHYNDFAGTPYEVGGRIVDLKNVDPETGEFADKGSHEDHADGKIAELKTKNPGSSYEKVPYLDALVQRYGDDTQSIVDAISKLVAKHGYLSNEDINKRFFVLRESTARGGEATDVSADSFKVVDPRDKRKNVWAEHVATDKAGNAVGGTSEQGKIWLRTADGREFATSTAKIIQHISKGTRREQGNAGDGRATGTAGQVDMLHQGLASLFAAEADGKAALAPVIGFRSAEGAPIKWGGLNAQIPDNLRMFSKTGATYGDAKRELAAELAAKKSNEGSAELDGRMTPNQRMLRRSSDKALRAEIVRLRDGKIPNVGLAREISQLSPNDAVWDAAFPPKKVPLTAMGPHTAGNTPAQRNAVRQGAIAKLQEKARIAAEDKNSVSEPVGPKRAVIVKDKEGELVESQPVPRGAPTPTQSHEVKSGPRSLHEDRGDKARTNEDHTGDAIGSVGSAPELLGTGMPAQKDLFKHPQGKLASHGTPSNARKAAAENDAAEKAGLPRGKLPLPKSGSTIAQRTDYVMEHLRKGAPHFLTTVRALSPAQQKAITKHLVAMLDGDVGVSAWDNGNVPKDFAKFTKAAVAALKALGVEVTTAKKGEIAESLVRFDKKGRAVDADGKLLPADRPVDWKAALKETARINGLIKERAVDLSKLPEHTPLWAAVDEDGNVKAAFKSMSIAKDVADHLGLNLENNTAGEFAGRAERDGAKYNAQSAQAPTGSDPWTNAQRVQFFTDINRRLGPKIKSVLTDKLFGKDDKGETFEISGQFLDDTISASIYATNVLQIGAHESMHALFKRLTDPESKAHRVTDLLLRAANSAPVVRQLERLLDGETNALKQIKAGAKDYAEERLAYMFQFHQAGLLTIGPETKTLFQKITDTLRAVFGVLSDDQKADQLLKAFDQGKMPDADAAMRVLERNLEWRENQYKAAAQALTPITNKLHRLVGTTEMNMKRHGVREYDEVVRMFKRAVGESGEQGFFDAKDQQTKIFTNKLARVFDGLEVKDLELTAKYLHSGEKPTDKVARDVVAKIKGGTDSRGVKHKGILPEMYEYMQRKGVKVWEASKDDPTKGEWVPVRQVSNYFPRVYDMEKLSAQGDAFVASLLKHNAKELEAIAAETEGKTSEDVAKAILARLTNSMGEPTLEETSSAVGFSPFAAAVNKRSLDWLSPEVIKEFGEKDVARVMTAYIVQAVKRAEYTERFGPDGGVLKAKLEAGHRTHFSNALGDKSGVNKAKLVDAMRDAAKREESESEAAWALVDGKMERKQFDDMYKRSLQVASDTAKDVMAMEGTLGYDVKPMVRKLNNAAVVYQNLRTLSTSIFSQVIDPMGMVARGAEMSDAWTAYKRGLREVGASFKNEHIKDKDAWVAEVVGTVDATNLLAQYGQLYGSQYMGGPFRRMNEAMFKYNGMEGFNRGMQIAGTRAAVNFIKRHSQERSARGDEYLAELNLKPGDVKVAASGDLNYTDPKIAAAIHQWVNGAVLRPNASQRTAWGSDPNYMAFWHMKQFAYTFHDTIIKRVVHDAKKYGDAGPAAMLVATTIPLMIGTDAMKSILLTGDEPAWMNQGLDAQLHHGAMRAGLGGMFQPELDALDGNHGLAGLAGPFAEQLAKIPDKTFGENVVNALPGANVLNRYAAP